MLTGIELAGLVLAVFPLVVSGLEHYGEGFQCIKEWIRFRVEYSRFLNVVCRQKIIFRQNIEVLLSPIVKSEYEMSQLLDNPGSKAWGNAELDEKLRKRLPGVMEYECYMATVSNILEVLEVLKHKLKIAHWTEKHSNAKKIRWELELKRLNYTLSHKRRESLMNELEKHNKDIQVMLGNSEKLEPMRRKRKSTIPKFFQQIRNQAHNLHSALDRAWKCDCKSSHATKLILEKRVRKDKQSFIDIQDFASVKFGVFFFSEIGSNLEWHATEIMLAERTAYLERKLSQGTEFGKRAPLFTDTGSKFDNNTMSQGSTIRSLSTASSNYSKLFDSGGRSVSFLGSSVESVSSWVPSSGSEIFDLCSTLKQRSKAPLFLGLLKNGTDQYLSLNVATEPKISSEDAACVINLESLLPTSSTGAKSTETDIALPRRVRLAIDVTLANSLLQLHSGPWLSETWSTKDIYFFQKSDGDIHTNLPLVHNQFQSWTNQDDSKVIVYPITARKQRSQSGNPSLLSLGILILELWFNRPLTSLSFRKDFLGPDGKENEFTNFNMALKWQEMTMEEAGPDLFNPTRRCIYCAFGTAARILKTMN